MAQAACFLGITGLPSGLAADGCYLDVQRRTASFTMPTTPTTFIWNTEVTDTDGMYDTATGEITCPFTGNYTFNFMFNTDASSGVHQIISAAELWSGSVWVKSEYSARQQAVRSGDNTQATYVSTNRFVAGTKLRFPTWCDSSVTLITEVPVNGAGFTIPAARLLITGIRTE